MITLGDVYRIKMYQSDGIMPKGNDTFRFKYVIIIGYDGENYYGAVSTNTRDHHLVPMEFQYPLKHDGYDCLLFNEKYHVSLGYNKGLADIGHYLTAKNNGFALTLAYMFGN